MTAREDGASKAMDDATWRGTEVGKWIERNGRAIQIDISKDREIARALNVRAVPMTIVFRSGRQEERMVGPHDAAEMSAWLSSLEKRHIRPDGYLRDSSAEMALNDHRYDEATEAYVWLWNNSPGFEDYETGWMGRRESFMVRTFASLVSNYPPAHKAFSAIRDASSAAAATFDLTDWFGPRVDWLVLNQVLSQQDRTLQWFDSVKADSRYAQLIEHCAILLLELLKAERRWSDIGRLYTDPLAALAQLHELVTLGSPQDQTSNYSRVLAERFREEVVVLYAGLRAAGRKSDASAVREKAIRLDPSDEMKRALEQAPGPSN